MSEMASTSTIWFSESGTPAILLNMTTQKWAHHILCGGTGNFTGTPSTVEVPVRLTFYNFDDEIINIFYVSGELSLFSRTASDQYIYSLVIHGEFPPCKEVQVKLYPYNTALKFEVNTVPCFVF